MSTKSQVDLTENNNIAISNLRLLRSNLWTPYHNWERDSKYWQALLHLDDKEAFEELGNICFNIMDEGDWCGKRCDLLSDLITPRNVIHTFIREPFYGESKGGVLLSFMDKFDQPPVVDMDNRPISEQNGMKIIGNALVNVLFSAFIYGEDRANLFGKLLVVQVVEEGDAITHGANRVEELANAFGNKQGGRRKTRARKVDAGPPAPSTKDDFDDSDIPFVSMEYVSTRSRRNPLASISKVAW